MREIGWLALLVVFVASIFAVGAEVAGDLGAPLWGAMGLALVILGWSWRLLR